VFLVAISGKFWKTLIKTAVVSTEVEGMNACEAVSQVDACVTFWRTW